MYLFPPGRLSEQIDKCQFDENDVTLCSLASSFISVTSQNSNLGFLFMLKRLGLHDLVVHLCRKRNAQKDPAQTQRHKDRRE